jgi:enoyl-CoA hydratase/carnithine racemase
MIEHLDDANTNATECAVVVTAVGERHFCTGADLRRWRGDAEPRGAPTHRGDGSRAIRTGIQRLIGRFLDCEADHLRAQRHGRRWYRDGACLRPGDCRRHRASSRCSCGEGSSPTGACLRSPGSSACKAEMVFFGDDLSAADAERLGIVTRWSRPPSSRPRHGNGPSGSQGPTNHRLRQATAQSLARRRSCDDVRAERLVEVVTATVDSAEHGELPRTPPDRVQGY